MRSHKSRKKGREEGEGEAKKTGKRKRRNSVGNSLVLSHKAEYGEVWWVTTVIPILWRPRQNCWEWFGSA